VTKTAIDDLGYGKPPRDTRFAKGEEALTSAFAATAGCSATAGSLGPLRGPPGPANCAELPFCAFEALGGVPAEILCDCMKTAMLGEVDHHGIAYNRKLLVAERASTDLATHYRFPPKACPPYRAKTKGKRARVGRRSRSLPRS
jgi:hypothetical protein